MSSQPSKPKVADVMRDTDLLVHPDHPLAEARRRLEDAGLAFAPVADGDEIVGLIARDDLAPSAVEKTPAVGGSPAVRDRMSATVPFLYRDDPASLAAAIGKATNRTMFCVVDRRHRLVGIVDLDQAHLSRGPARVTARTRDCARRRLAVTASRATASAPGDIGSYADRPSLYIRPPASARGADER